MVTSPPQELEWGGGGWWGEGVGGAMGGGGGGGDLPPPGMVWDGNERTLGKPRSREVEGLGRDRRSQRAGFLRGYVHIVSMRQ